MDLHCSSVNFFRKMVNFPEGILGTNTGNGGGKKGSTSLQLRYNFGTTSLTSVHDPKLIHPCGVIVPLHSASPCACCPNLSLISSNGDYIVLYSLFSPQYTHLFRNAKNTSRRIPHESVSFLEMGLSGSIEIFIQFRKSSHSFANCGGFFYFRERI